MVLSEGDKNTGEKKLYMNDFVLNIEVTKLHVQVTILAVTGDYTTGFRDNTTSLGDDSVMRQHYRRC